VDGFEITMVEIAGSSPAMMKEGGGGPHLTIMPGLDPGIVTGCGACGGRRVEPGDGEG
jgi:hypothetical protein